MTHKPDSLFQWLARKTCVMREKMGGEGRIMYLYKVEKK